VLHVVDSFYLVSVAQMISHLIFITDMPKWRFFLMKKTACFSLREKAGAFVARKKLYDMKLLKLQLILKYRTNWLLMLCNAVLLYLDCWSLVFFRV